MPRVDRRLFVLIATLACGSGVLLGGQQTAAYKVAADASWLYGRGVAKRMSGDTAGGDADVAAATRSDSGIAAKFRSWGVAAAPARR